MRPVARPTRFREKAVIDEFRWSCRGGPAEPFHPPKAWCTLRAPEGKVKSSCRPDGNRGNGVRTRAPASRARGPVLMDGAPQSVRLAGQLAASSALGLVRCGSTATPGPMVEAMVTFLR